MRILIYTVVCLVLPVAWGALVHVLFNVLRKRHSASGSSVRQPTEWPDYQI